MPIHVRRLMPGDEAAAARLFALLAAEFGERHRSLSRRYRTRLLTRGDLWIVAAFEGRAVVGGLTAHVLPMTRSEHAELFVYDVAVSSRHRRRGVGRALLRHLCEHGLVGDALEAFVLAEGDDADARAFYRALGGRESPAAMFTFRRGGARRRASRRRR